MAKFYIECKKSTKTGNEYIALTCDLGYRTCLLTVDKSTIAEVGGMSIADLYSMKVGDKIAVKVDK